MSNKKSNPHLVVQSNHFINLRHTLNFSEARVFYKMVAMIEGDDEDFKTYRIDVKEFTDLMGLKGHGHYAAIEQVAEGLLKKTFKHREEDGSFMMMNYIAYAKYTKGSGYVELGFYPLLKPYLLNLKEQFTQYDIRNIISIRSYYSFRIYELLKQYEKIKFREFDLDELKVTLNIEGKYKLYNDFKKDILEVAKRDLLAITDISFDYLEIKQGRKIQRIRFLIHSKDPKTAKDTTQPVLLPDRLSAAEINPLPPIETIDSEVLTLFTEFCDPGSEEEATQFLGGLEAQKEDIVDVLLYARLQKTKGIPIKNIYAFTINGLKTKMGKGLSQKATEKAEAEQKRQEQRVNQKKISEWQKREFDNYLSEYYEMLGSEADKDRKSNFFTRINEQIAQNPNLKVHYYKPDGQPNQPNLRVALGLEISAERHETKDQLFIQWVKATKSVSLLKVGDTWQIL